MEGPASGSASGASGETSMAAGVANAGASEAAWSPVAAAGGGASLCCSLSWLVSRGNVSALMGVGSCPRNQRNLWMRGMLGSRGKSRSSIGTATSIAANRASSHLTKLSSSTHDSRNWSVSALTRMTYRRLSSVLVFFTREAAANKTQEARTCDSPLRFPRRRVAGYNSFPIRSSSSTAGYQARCSAHESLTFPIPNLSCTCRY